ncbi:hypothetical protein DFH28DRAFT_969033, partial [Melampsora americana]
MIRTSITLILAFIAALSFAAPTSITDSVTRGLIQRNNAPNLNLEPLNQDAKLSRRFLDWLGWAFSTDHKPKHKHKVQGDPFDYPDFPGFTQD